MKSIDEFEFTRKKILRQSSVRSTWLNTSYKHNSDCISESKLELDFYFSVLFDIDLLDIISQPQTFKQIRYTPDFYIKYPNKIVFIEVKYFKETLSDDFKQKTKIRTAFFKEHGAEYRVVTEKEIRNSQAYINNRLILLAERYPKPIEEFNKIKRLIPHCELPIKELTLLLIQNNCKPCFIRRALVHRLINANLTPSWPEVIIKW